MPVPEVPGSPGAWDVPGAGREDGQGRGRRGPRSPGGLRLRCPSTFRGVPPPVPSLLRPWVLAGRLSGTSLDPLQLSRPYPGGINFPGAGPRRLSRDPPPAELPAGVSLPRRVRGSETGSLAPSPGGPAPRGRRVGNPGPGSRHRRLVTTGVGFLSFGGPILPGQGAGFPRGSWAAPGRPCGPPGWAGPGRACSGPPRTTSCREDAVGGV